MGRHGLQEDRYIVLYHMLLLHRYVMHNVLFCMLLLHRYVVHVIVTSLSHVCYCYIVMSCCIALQSRTALHCYHYIVTSLYRTVVHCSHAPADAAKPGASRGGEVVGCIIYNIIYIHYL